MPQPQTLWEYAVQEVDANAHLLDIENLLSQLGTDGWELVTAIPVPGNRVRYVFKRPRS